ncbi:MAG: hypothetical protein RJA70_2431 [Pseudomonadota bacterium]|jgi:ABC-type cobalamin/Fe3+-siderophores transport system ATPase subunit
MSKASSPPVEKLGISLKCLAAQTPHILGLRFPNFRNFEHNEEIRFDFPITVLLGKNGTNKSSLLHALYGAPKGETTAIFWFETALDGIPAQDEKGRKPSVIHWYKNDKGKTIHCIKARAPRGAKDPDYWEPIKPSGVYDFESDFVRGPPVALKVLRLDFRGILPAFDKYFYFPDQKHLRGLAAQAKAQGTLRREYRSQDYLRKKSQGLKAKIMAEGTPLSSRELAVLGYVLERKYTAGRLLEHDRFRQPGETLLFETKNLGQGYSEAFAGSGESAAAMLIHKIENAPDNSLVLLDEPETSLHPRAQRRMMEFLAESASKKRLQIVIATHSSELAGQLPAQAIRVLSEAPNGKIRISENISVREALHDIADLPHGTTILVEDERAKAIVMAELKHQSPTALAEYRVVVRGAGTSRIYRDIRAHAVAGQADLIVVFDGDQHPAEPIPSDNDIPTGLLARLALIQRLTRGNDKKGPDLDLSSPEEALKYVQFLRTRVFYLPAKTPEELVWSDDAAAGLVAPLPSTVTDEPNFKEKIRKLAGEVVPSEETFVFSTLLHAFLRTQTNTRVELKHLIGRIRSLS